MCVTNIAKRRNVAVANASAAMVSSTPSVISQRLMDNFMPLMMNNSMAKPILTVSTLDTVETSRTALQLNSLHSFPQQEQTLSCGLNNDIGDKKRPKRRRKPQKPGKTAKQNDRHFVVHNYHDHALDADESDDEHEETGGRRGGRVSISFPAKLHAVLHQVEADGWGHVISWMPHGRCFVIHKLKEFSENVMPHYFRQSKLTSFQRQLNLYGFCRITTGKDAGGYYHERFLRGRTFLAQKLQRTKIKGTKFKAASSPEQEPDFYAMPPVMPMAQVSDDSSADVSAVVSQQNLVSFNSTTGYYMPKNGPSLVPPSPLSMEPFPVQVPRSFTLPSVDPYPMMSHYGAAPSMIHNNNTVQMPFIFTSAYTGKSNADQVLDDAVDELFNESNKMVLDLDHAGDYVSLWDTTEFGQESREDDLYLGFLLEKLLET